MMVKDKSIMDLRLLATTFLTLITTGSTIAIAQTPVIPKPDRNGDYFRNETPIKGKAPNPLMSGSLWKVIAPGLNCRSGAGLNYEITRRFNQGEILQAEVGRGGADEVLLNAKDKNGKPWMFVRSSLGKNYDCYVRANQFYIQPYQGKGDRPH